MNDIDARRVQKLLESARSLRRTFYDRNPVAVARELLGTLLVRTNDAGTTAGRIVEAEAYLASGDPASHSYTGRKNRNASMFGPPGHAYVYAIHSRWCFNVVTEPAGAASAVLIRAIEPLVGVELMQARRGARRTPARHGPRAPRPAVGAKTGRSREMIRTRDLCRGPARLCEALAIDRGLDGWDLTRGEALWLAAAPELPPVGEIGTSPRIGVTSAHDRPLRFFCTHSPYVSGRRRG